MASPSRDETLTHFQAVTGIDDVELAMVHLESAQWDLIAAVRTVLGPDTQTLPSERTVFPSAASVDSFRGYSDMDHESSELDPSRIEIDDIDEPVLISPPPRRESNGVIRDGRQGSSSSVSKSKTDSSSTSAILNSVKHNNIKSGGSSSNSHAKVTLSSDFMKTGPSGSKKGVSSKEIEFKVRYDTTGESFSVPLAECETVDTLKTLIHARFEVPPCQQRLKGWPNKDPADGAKLGSLNLPKEINLSLFSSGTAMDFTPGTSSSSVSSKGTEDKYTLRILEEGKNETMIIHFNGSTTVRGVKEDMSHATDIPVRFQVWTGWPVGTTDTMTLSVCGLNKPHHSLTVKKQVSAPSSADVSKRMMDLGDGSETSSDVEDLTESYPLEEDFYTPEASVTPQRFLIPDNTPDEAVGTIQFADNFLARYGACHPMFFHGTLEDAVKEACFQPAKNRKLMAIYLHHDGSVVSNVFCQHILCNESIVSYLTSNYVVWGWDVTNESNRQLLLAAANKNFGAPGVSTIRSIERERYPVIIIVSRIRATTEICNVIYGPTAATVDELMGNLMNTSEMYQTQRVTDIRDEDEREARERVKREQDEAYEESLIADRAKDEARRAIEHQKLTEEMKVQQAAEQAQMLRDQIALTLPPEPDVNCTDPVCSLKCRLPGGKIVSRRFLQTTTLNVMFDYLFTQGFSRDEYRFLTTYPKRDLSDMAASTTMNGIFSPQDTLIVEER